MRYGLKEDTIERIKEVFSLFPCVQKVTLYGSRAKGNYRDASDIDLTLHGKNLHFSTLHDIAITLDELYLPYKIDLCIYDNLKNQDLKESIDKFGVGF